MSKKIIITGNPQDGFAYYGPFPTMEDARQFAEAECRGDSWWIADITTPLDYQNDVRRIHGTPALPDGKRDATPLEAFAISVLRILARDAVWTGRTVRDIAQEACDHDVATGTSSSTFDAIFPDDIADPAANPEGARP